MSLFQICYGPEISSIFNVIRKYPGIELSLLVKKFQNNEDADITSLVDAAVTFLSELGFIRFDENKYLWPIEESLSKLKVLTRLNQIAKTVTDETDPNHIFSSIYFEIFVKSNELYIKDLHYQTNFRFERYVVGQEKINAWKRIMQYFGLGYRLYGGFYALPHLDVLEELLNENENWEGPIQKFFENKVHPIIPCVYRGQVYRGIVFALLNLNNQIYLSKKQDLPFQSYGPNKEWNWMRIGGELKNDTMYNQAFSKTTL